MLNSIIPKIKQAKFLPAPYKVLVIDHFLQEEEYDLLESSFPQYSPFIHAKTLFETSTKQWKHYLTAINSVDFYNTLLEKFESPLKVEAHTLGLRKKDLHRPYVTESYTVTRTDSNIDRTLNNISPLEQCWMLPPHRDSQYTILSLVHYFPQPNILLTGGSFFIVQPKQSPRYFKVNSTISYAYPDDFEVISEISYQKNRVVAMLSDESSWHAIGPCNFQRRSVNMSLELQNDGRRTLC